MRPIAITVLLTLSLAGACGRIGYAPLDPEGAGGTFASGTGGVWPGTGGAATGGMREPTGGAAMTGGTSGTGGTAAGGGAMNGSGGGGGGGANGSGGSGTGGGAMTGGTGGIGSGGASAGGTGGRANASGGAGAVGTGGAAGMVGRTGGAGGQVAGTGGGGGGSGGPCRTDSFGGHTYAFCVGPLSWPDAQADCVAKGMRLARIDDGAENAWVLSVAFAGISSMSSLYWSWLGATDVAVSKQWRWTDGALFWMGGASGTAQGGLYSNWAGGSPSNGGTGADCGILEHSGFWKDFDCDILERYVCERY